MDNAYTLSLHCHNCGDVAEYTIEKGMRVVTVPCENCGVKQLKRVEYYVQKEINRKKDEDDDDDLLE